MPFTLSHPAAVIGLRRAGLPMVGLVAGSMIPDAPMFGLVPWSYALSHSVLGLVTVDAAAGTVAVVLWTLLINGALASASPRWLRDRLGTPSLTRRGWLLMPVAVAVGGATHIVWDALTHKGRWGTQHVRWLREEHLGYAGYHWAQATSSAVGLVVLALSVGLTMAHRRPSERPARATIEARWALALVGVCTAVAAVGFGAAAGSEGLHAAAFSAAVHSLTVLSLGLVLAGCLWRFAARSG